MDDAAHLLLPDGRGGAAYLTLPIEVKNVRHWMYPSAWEIYQLLDKAARLLAQHPDHRLVPVLVCRRAHYTTFFMARDLGFLVFETILQPILPHSDVKETALTEVREELGYQLERTDDPLPLLTQSFRERVPEHAIRTATRWAATAPTLAPCLQQASPIITHRLLPRGRGSLIQASRRQPARSSRWLNQAPDITIALAQRHRGVGS